MNHNHICQIKLSIFFVHFSCKKKRQREDDDENEHHYPSKNIHPEVHTFAIKLFNVLKLDGMKKTEFLHFMDKAGYKMSQKTFNRHIQNLETSGNVLSIDKKSGAKYLLSDDQKMIAAGFVFYENAKNREFHEKEYKEFIKNHFNVDISRVTANNYLHEAGFTSRAMTTKKGGFKYDAQTLIEMYWNWNWIYKIRRDGLFTTNGSKLCSIDFVFTSHRSDRRTTFAQKNTPTPKSSKDIPKYTNCILTCIWKDGINRNPPMLFTIHIQPRFSI